MRDFWTSLYIVYIGDRSDSTTFEVILKPNQFILPKKNIFPTPVLAFSIVQKPSFYFKKGTNFHETRALSIKPVKIIKSW